MKFIHISDLHFHKNPAKNGEVNVLLNKINNKYPHHNLLITGDIVDDGHERQYREAFHALEPLKHQRMSDIVVIPDTYQYIKKK